MKKFNPSRITFYGRSIKEYSLMFNLDFESLPKSQFIDIPAGPASFCSEARALGHGVLSIDPCYSKTSEELFKIGLEDIDYINEKIRATSRERVWDFYKDPDDLKCKQKSYLKAFIDDFSSEHISGNPYVSASLPNLPFENNTFDYALSGHFLFSFHSQIGYSLTLDSIKELTRIAKEVRIFPLKSNEQSRESEFPEMRRLLDDLSLHEINYRIEDSAFEFQKGANQVMILK